MIAITGASGQLGQALTECCTHHGMDFVGLSRADLDITDAAAVKNFFFKHPCDCIFNCAAYTQVDAAEDNPGEACLVNSFAPWNLARTSIPVIHISTDYVFDGSNSTPSLLEGAFRGVIVRTAWTYSARSGTKNFFHTMRKLFKERSSIGVVNDQFGTPTLAEDLAQALLDLYLMKQHLKPMHVLHYTNAGLATWFEFAQAIARLSNANCTVKPITTSEFPTKAHRPAYSVLSLQAIEELGIKPRSWLDALESIFKNKTAHV